MNFYMNITFYDFIHEFIQNKDSAKENKPITETFASNVDDMIYTTLNSVKKEIYNNPNISSSNKNKEIIFALNNRGIFQIKDSVSVVAKLLNISKNTVYLHLRNCEDDSTK